ncbi:unnamed protein product [Trypanosoma congolense IL3000]|uniref:WGS project CAEQ00000000 data, annotated contig 1965 n=1 Tax=Trypanosoma congolense (strain IL3000) TaxID=1068625 RepID=F9WAE9_TRYCI|nr:unnamed protein product [Trypanosoma congolense IL3000]
MRTAVWKPWLCHALEGYLRCFSFWVRRRTLPAAPQKIVGDVLMSSILEHRVYNATYVPGLSGSLFPSKRIESVFSLLGELVRYHYGNLKILQDYIVGDVDLSHLNGSHSTALPHTRQLHVGSERMEQLIRLPPLDREEHEPFAKVLLRRISRHGCDTNLFLRSLLISLTPGLRSKINYMWKPVTDDTVDARELLSVSSRVGDIVTCCPNRFSYVGTCSRSFVVLLAERQRKARALVRGGMTGGDGAAHTPEGVSSVTGPASLLSPDATLWDMLQMLLRVPHRYSVEERPFPQFFDDYDRAIVMGSIDLPPVGPPPHLAVPLFSEEGCHASLVRIEEVLFQKPPELLYGILGPLHAERFHSTGRLCGVTTCIFVFARVARLGGASAVRDVLENIKPLARVGYEKWREHRYATSHCARGKKRRESEGAGNNSVGDHSVPDSRCHCQAGDGTLRCSSFLLHGHCAPRSAVALYHMNYGGCFFCNMFRLLCCWVGHYGACQRYVETLFYCTEVPFAELKCVMLYLFRLLPDFFMLEAP